MVSTTQMENTQNHTNYHLQCGTLNDSIAGPPELPLELGWSVLSMQLICGQH